MKEIDLCVLELDQYRNVIGGSQQNLIDSINRGADLRIYTEFRHNEHIDTSSDNNQLIKEVSDFPCTYVIDGRWVSAMMTLRQPVTLPDRFGDRPSMSFFMYNQNGIQCVARPFLDRAGQKEQIGLEPPEMFNGRKEEKPMLRMHPINASSDNNKAVWSNFIYDFYSYKFFANERWVEVYAHDENGNVTFGSAKALEEASEKGYEIKVGISGICDELNGEKGLSHQVFIETGPHYYYTESNFMVAETRPFVRVVPKIPTTYDDKNWDFGWAIVRSDGHVAGLWYDPYTLKYTRTYSKHAMRWFVKNK